ncbi:MAG: hypothetical protein ABI376_05490 [Caulobacteraceae bacterium]
MKTTLIAVTASAALLTACAGGSGYGFNDYGPGPVGVVGYTGFYDGYYGSINNGYLGNDGFFYYRSHGDRQWRRDDGRHFRREATQGFHPYRGHEMRGGDHRGHHRDQGPG